MLSSIDWTCFLIKQITSNMYRDGRVKMLNFLNNCLQDVLEFTPAIDLITLFWSVKIFLFMLFPALPHNNIPNRSREWNFVKYIFRIMSILKISLNDLIMNSTLLSLLARAFKCAFHFSDCVICIPRNLVSVI